MAQLPLFNRYAFLVFFLVILFVVFFFSIRRIWLVKEAKLSRYVQRVYLPSCFFFVSYKSNRCAQRVGLRIDSVLLWKEKKTDKIEAKKVVTIYCGP